MISTEEFLGGAQVLISGAGKIYPHWKNGRLLTVKATSNGVQVILPNPLFAKPGARYFAIHIDVASSGAVEVFLSDETTSLGFIPVTGFGRVYREINDFVMST